MIEIDQKYAPLLLEVLEDAMYKLSLQLEDFKGGPLSQERKALAKKQKQIEALQHLISES